MTGHEEPAVGSVMENYVDGGWDALSQAAADKTAEDNLEARAEQYRVAKDYIPCFTSPAGEAVLEDLLNRTLRRSTWDQTEGMDRATAAGLFREGQNSIVAYILGMMRAARGGPPHLPGGEEDKT